MLILPYTYEKAQPQLDFFDRLGKPPFRRLSFSKGVIGMYDFNEMIDRRGRNSAKWDRRFIGEGAEEKLPFWVADTDFRALPQVNDALEACVRHGIYGYTLPPEGCAAAVARWQQVRHGFEVKEEWVSFLAGIDCALATAIQAFTEPGDAVLVNTPIYTPFFEMAERNGRRVVENPMKLVDGRYEFDFEDFEEKARQAKLFLFCNPQNPTSRCLTREELTRIGQICARHDLLILADEIHADILFDGRKHVPIASLSPELARRTITCTSPSKTFSVAGLVASAIIIPDEGVRQAFEAVKERNSINTGILGLVAMKAAYESGDAYADELVAYLQENRDFAVDYIRKHIPGITPIVPEATFLLWLDCAGLGLEREKLEGFFTSAGVRLSGGTAYKEPTGLFARLNFGCTRATLEAGLRRIEAAARALPG